MESRAPDDREREPELDPRPEPEHDPRPEPEPAVDGLDLLTIGLVVFFLSLIAIVGAMLLLPAIL